LKKKILKGLKYAAGMLVLLIAGFYAYVQATYKRDFSSTPLPAITAVKDPDVIKRGEYVAHSIAHCSACHGAGEWTNKHELPPDVSNLSGGYVLKAGPFGTYYPVNLTPDPETGIAKLSDAHLARAIRHGVASDGTLAPLMSFAVGPMDDEDLVAVISYLRSIKPVKNPVPKDEWGFVAKALAGKFNPRMAKAPAFVKEKEGEPSAERGEYIANGPGICIGCHSPYDFMDGFKMKGAPFSGAFEPEPDPTEDGMETMPPNITKGGVLGNFEEEQFVDRFKKAGRAFKGSSMPWENFARMTDDDLKSIYLYLTTKVPPSDRNTGPTRRKAGSFKG
jgi:mono/diheme cytochrome c family protein